MKKQSPRTNWEVTVTPPDAEPTVYRRRLTTMSLTNWIDQIISDLGLDMQAYKTRIEVTAILDTGERRHIATY